MDIFAVITIFVGGLGYYLARWKNPRLIPLCTLILGIGLGILVSTLYFAMLLARLQ